jgi:hypothetical protein
VSGTYDTYCREIYRQKPQNRDGARSTRTHIKFANLKQLLFLKGLKLFYEKHKLLLEERTHTALSKKKWWYVRRELRSAYYSILNFYPYLFTYEQDEYISKTTNSLEAHFRHIKDVLNIHCGISKSQKQDVLDSIMVAGTIAPKGVTKRWKG